MCLLYMASWPSATAMQEEEEELPEPLQVEPEVFFCVGPTHAQKPAAQSYGTKIFLFFAAN